MASTTSIKSTLEGRRDYLLVEPCSLDDLKSPLRGSARLKYTCFDVSSRYIAVGSNTGSVYIFDKISLRHLQVVFTDAEPSSVNNVKICSTNKTVAFSMLNGHVQVMELNIDKRQKPDRLRAINNHVHQTVSCIQWDAGGQKLYTADSVGNVVVSLIPTSKMKNLVLAPIEVILSLSVPVIQLDLYQDKLLVSTRTECFLCNTAKANYLQIGTKPRDGLYGGCFLQGGSTTPIIYCARPGSRLWEVDMEGSVQHTHQFKQLLAIPPTHILSVSGDAILRTENKQFPPLGTNFPVLKSYGEKFILTWNKTKLFILDPLQEKPRVILWTEFQTEILEVCVQGSELYIFFVSGEIRKVTLMTVSRVVSLLVSRKLWQLAAQVCGTYSQSIIASKNHKELSRNTLRDLVENVQNGCLKEYEERVVELFEKISAEVASSSETEGSEYSRSRSSSGASIIRLESGIYQIKNSKSSASLDSWNETLSQDEPDSGISSPAKLPYAASEIVVSVLDAAESDKDFNFNDTFKTDQEGNVRNNESNAQLEDSPSNFILCGDVVVRELSDLEHSTLNGVSNPVVVNGQSDLVHSTMNKEELNRLIHSDDIFADDEILVPRGPSKLPSKKSEPSRLSNIHGTHSHENSMPSVDDEEQNKSFKEEVFDVVPLQDQDITPLIVTRTESRGQPRHSTRRKAVTVNIDEGKKKSGKQHKRHSRSKGKESDSDVRSQGPSDTSSNLISNAAPQEQSGNIPVIQSKSPTLQRTESCPAIPEKSGLIRSSSATDLHSPSQSPLTQSWEEPQDSNKRTLTSVKDSLQSKFANTKMKILKTIKEKKMMASSPKDTKDPFPSQETQNIPEEQELKEDIPVSEPEKESCIVDLTEFIQKTVQTKSKMQDFTVLLNPGALRETLFDWMTHLNIIMRKLNTHKCLKLLQTKHFERCRSQQLASSEETMETSLIDQDSGINDSENSQMAENELNSLKNNSDVNIESYLHLNPSLIVNNFRVQELCHVEDPFSFSEDMLVTVKDLARKCFNSKCIHNVMDSVQPDLGAISFCDICADCYLNNETKLSDTPSVLLSSSLSPENKGIDCDDKTSETEEGITSTVPVPKETGSRNTEYSNQEPCGNTVNISNVEHGNTGKRCISAVEFCESFEKRNLFGLNDEMHTVVRESDSDLSVFVRCYFFLMDKKDLIQHVHSRESTLSEEEKFEIWIAWMEGLQVKYREDPLLFLDKRSKEEAISALELTKHDHQKNLFYVYKLFKNFPSETVTFCVTCDNIQPMDIVYLCQLYHQKEAGFLDQFMCGRYKDLQSSTRLSKSNLNADKRVIYTWLQTLMEKTKNCKQLKDEYDNPWLFSHSKAWADEDKIDFILQIATEDQGEKCLEMCRKAGYWRGCLLLLKKQHKWNEMVTMIFCLGDLQLIHQMELLPETAEEWKSFTELFQSYYAMHHKLYHPAEDEKQQATGIDILDSNETQKHDSLASSVEHLPEQTETGNTFDSNLQMYKENSFDTLVNKTVSESTYEQNSSTDVCVDIKETNQNNEESFGIETNISCNGQCISWSDVAFLMLQYMDVSVCVGLLSGMDIPEGCVNRLLYKSSITTALKHRQQRNVLHNLLEKIDSYLWAKKPNTLMPELQFAISVERKSKGFKKERSTDHLMALLSEKPTTGKRYREDSECHWGVSTNMLKCCRICNVALTESISHVEPGILMFECGHGFHKLCCQGRVCQLCS